MKPSNIIDLAGARVAPVLIEQGIAHFMQRLTLRGGCDNTLDAYGRDLADFAEFAALHGIHLIGLISERLVARWVDRMAMRGLSPRTIRRRLSSLRSFLRHAKLEGWIDHDPTKDQHVKVRMRRVVAPELSPLLDMIDDIPAEHAADIRDRAMLRLGLDAALRISEVVGLDMADPMLAPESCVDLQRLQVHVIGKGGDTETVGINERTAAFLRAWLAVRGTMAGPECTALFVSRRGQRLCRQQLHNRFKHWCRRAGLAHATFHQLRHRRVGEVVETLGLEAGQQLARHAHKSTTANVYGAHAAEIVRHQVRQHCDLDARGRAA